MQAERKKNRRRKRRGEERARHETWKCLGQLIPVANWAELRASSFFHQSSHQTQVHTNTWMRANTHPPTDREHQNQTRALWLSAASSINTHTNSPSLLLAGAQLSCIINPFHFSTRKKTPRKKPRHSVDVRRKHITYSYCTKHWRQEQTHGVT